ncbi:hypothetical protein [Hymenobacter metallicola]|uniref:Uncharacterized protein n=1 Tax=Hymenobacter metallicola TaxID=2563114 RepID=A0A4Z0QI83_9BACT|nr:hypothetical protein [Hymenobacter metallicola]TGE29788.1 hypothetical protein E5K02_10115 [Hymenobacter metallicola]
MKLPTPTEAKEKTVSWLARNLYIILAVSGVVLVISAGVLCFSVNRLEDTVAENPPLTKKQVRAHEKAIAAKKDSAVKLQAAAVRRDSAATRKLAKVTAKEKHIDSLLLVNYEIIRTRPAASAQQLHRILSNYGRTKADTAQ